MFPPVRVLLFVLQQFQVFADVPACCARLDDVVNEA